ncbi:MAG: glycosyltransferase family 2 protein [Candidatus Riflebacteria bacterium]|nr:glycosyltransferase family 2 protein [Candidatus Riflebacteria bacterium]
MPTPRVTVVVLNWNGAAVIRDCLQGLRFQTFRRFSTLVVDNASTDGSPGLVRREFPEVELLELRENRGFAGGNNAGIGLLRRTRPTIPYIALLNNDARPQTGWLAALVTALEERPGMGMAASKMLRWDGVADPSIIDCAGTVFYTCGRADKRGEGCDAALFSRPEEVFGACAGAALYRAGMLDEIGLFDADLFAYHEDVDLDLRARWAGWGCWYVPEAVVWHRVGHSARIAGLDTVVLAKRNISWVLIKNWPASLFLRHGLSVGTYNLLSDLWGILRGRGRAVLAARWATLRGLPKVLRKRTRVMGARKIDASEFDRWIVPTPWLRRVGRALERLLERFGRVVPPAPRGRSNAR